MKRYYEIPAIRLESNASDDNNPRVWWTSRCYTPVSEGAWNPDGQREEVRETSSREDLNVLLEELMQLRDTVDDLHEELAALRQVVRRHEARR